MSFHKVLTAAAFASSAAASNCDFGGYFRDRKHYKEGTFAGSRFVTSRTGDKEGKDITLIGTDDGTTFWTFHGEAAQALCAINVDFSPKGGPAKLSGKYGHLGQTPNIAIDWSDGNYWMQMKIPDFALSNHPTQRSIGGFYQDPKHIKNNSWAGFRMISSEEGDKETTDGLTLIGSDDGTNFWMLKGKHMDKLYWNIAVDFRPMGGANLVGRLTTNLWGNHIEWKDHSVWTKMVVAQPPLTVEPAKEVASENIDSAGQASVVV